MIATRSQVRHEVHVYMSVTGIGIPEIAQGVRLAPQTIRQFLSAARFGSPPTEGEETARRLSVWMAANPAEIPQLPGTLYETSGTRQMDELIAYCALGRQAVCYVPAGGQKTFLFRYRAAESTKMEEPIVALVEIPDASTPTGLLRLIAAALRAPYAHTAETLRRSILRVLRRRVRPVALVLDEANLLYPRIDTLQVLRRVADLADGKVGVLLAGNEEVLDLFNPRRKQYFEQWRSRLVREMRLPGPSRDDARRIVAGEAPRLPDERAKKLLDGSEATDPITRKKYINLRTLFETLRPAEQSRRVN